MIGTLDTLEVAKELRAAGFTDEQAEAVTRVVKRAQDFDLSDLVTKADVNELRAATKADITGSEMRLRTEMAELRAELIKRVVGIAFAEAATIIAMLKLFPAAHL